MRGFVLGITRQNRLRQFDRTRIVAGRSCLLNQPRQRAKAQVTNALTPRQNPVLVQVHEQVTAVQFEVDCLRVGRSLGQKPGRLL